MSLLQKFFKNVAQQNLFQKNDFLLLAVSGGVDSVALCELCFQAGFYFEIAHCNFQLRGEESERDEKFVMQLAEKYQAKTFVKKFDTKKYAEENKISIQVAARELRYNWFDELLKAGNMLPASDSADVPLHNRHSRFLLTAHHANDNVETLLMNFFKGTGMKGLQGILPKQGKIIRPLLFAKKVEIIEFVKEFHLDFVEDSSNASDKYTRNYFRNQLLPSIEKVFPKVEENLMQNIERFRETEILFQQALNFHKKKLLERKGNEIHIPVLKLLKTQPLKTVLYEIIKDFGFTAHQSVEAIHLLTSESGKYISSATHRIIKNRNWLIIAPVNTLEAEYILIDKADTEIEFELGKLVFKYLGSKPAKISSAVSIAILDEKEIKFPLLLRKWKQGDYFYPLGMQKKKKISKFLIDNKTSATGKEKTWVIESNKKILWLIAKRIDDRFKINDRTERVLSIELVSSKNMM